MPTVGNLEVGRQYRMSDVHHLLTVGQRISTNGAVGGIATMYDEEADEELEYYYTGTIVYIGVEYIYVDRGDGISARSCVSRYSDDISIEILSDQPCVLTKERKVKFLKYGDTISRTQSGPHYLVLQKISLYAIRVVLKSNPQSGFFLLETGSVCFIKHKSIEDLPCSAVGCNKPTVITVSGNHYCDDHQPVDTVQCSHCGINHTLAVVRVTRAQTITRPARYICSSCAETLDFIEDGVIHNYSFKPRPIFIIGTPKSRSFSAKILCGVEQEVECRHDTSSRGLALRAHDKFLVNKRKWFYMKADGSLAHGFEVVTHPANLQGHYALPWEELCDFYKEEKFQADETTTCGLHIHTNKNILEQDHQIRLAYLISTQRDKMEVIARRPENRWAYFKKKWQPIRSLNTSKVRYEALNWRPEHTVEFRLFKGTTKHDILMSSIEFVHASVLFTKGVKIGEMRNRTKGWQRFINFVNAGEYKHLPNYLKERSIS